MENEIKKELQNDIKKEVLSWLGVIIFAVILATFITNVIIVNAKVPSGSMENTIMTGDRVVAFRLSYLFSPPERYDIVVFPAPDEPQTLFVKRIIGLPGDTVNIVDGQVYIDDADEPLDSSFVRGELMGDYGPYVVPENSYFMLGDNRNNSKDARFWTHTYVSSENILGKVIFRYFPLSKNFIIK